MEDPDRDPKESTSFSFKPSSDGGGVMVVTPRLKIGKNGKKGKKKKQHGGNPPIISDSPLSRELQNNGNSSTNGKFNFAQEAQRSRSPLKLPLVNIAEYSNH